MFRKAPLFFIAEAASRSPIMPMLCSRKFPLLYIFEAALWAALIPEFFLNVAFLASTPVGSLHLEGRSLPPGWEAAYPNHGRYVRGYLIGHHPLAFAGVLVLLLITAAALLFVQVAELRQRAATGPSLVRRIAQGAVFLLVVAQGYIYGWHVFFGIAPH